MLGQMAISAVGHLVDPRLSSDLDNYVWDEYVPTAWVAGRNERLSGAYGAFMTPSPAMTSVVGQQSNSFFHDFYNRIHVNPRIVALGNSFDSIQRDVSVWNAYLTSKNLSSIAETGTDGMLLSGVTAPPLTYAPLQEHVYTLTVTLLGPAAIDATYTFNFPGEPVSMSVVGSRVTVWPFAPNWQTPVNETLEWKTQVIRSFDGSEQRRELRTKARRSFSYYMSLSGDSAARFDNFLWGWQNRSFAMPVWMDKRRVTSSVTVGATSISVSTTDRSFAAGGLAILFKDEVTYEIVEVQTVLANTLTLSRQTAQAWPVGTVIYPVVIGQLPTSVAVMRHSDRAISATVDFDCDPVSTNPYIPVATATLTYGGVEVIARQPNWKSGVDNTSEFAYETLDMGTGAVLHYQTEQFPRISRAYKWLLKSRESIRQMRELLGRTRGQLKSVYIPTWHQDLRVVVDIDEAAVSIVVADNDFHLMVGVNLARDRLMVRLVNGTVFYRKILGTSKVAEGTMLTLDSAFGQDILKTSVRNVFMLMRNRLATDKIELQWHTDSVVVTNTPFITVKE